MPLFWLGRLVLFGLCLAGAWWSVQLARAGYHASRGTERALRAALQLTPGNAAYLERLAGLMDSESALDQALARHPRRAGTWIEKAYLREARGDFGGAEACYLQAAAVDRTWKPAWSLANFYLRRGDEARFWSWGRRAAAIRYADCSALFALALRASSAPEEIVSRLDLSPGATRQYVAFLTRQGRPDLGAAALERLAPRVRSADLPLLADYVERALEAGAVDHARAGWALLAGRGLVAGPDSGAGPVSNGGFLKSPLGRGFDWRWPSGVRGVSFSHAPGELRVTLTGQQPESIELLEQRMLLEPGRRYRLRVVWEALHLNLAAAGGLGWRLDSTALSEAPFPATGPAPHRLVLAYQRPPGQVRAEGTVVLRRVALEAAE